MGCEESFITIKLIQYNYLVLNLDNYSHKTPTETGLKDYRHGTSQMGMDMVATCQIYTPFTFQL